MKVIVLLVLILVFWCRQTPQTDTPDMAVLKFKCGRHNAGNGLIRSVDDPSSTGNEPIRITPQARNEPQEVKNRRDMLERRAEMRTTEINAQLSGQPESKIYFYRIQVQNIGSKAVKSFVWEYRPTDEPDPSNRQFFCVVNAKPSEKKEFDLYSPLTPSRVVDVSKPNEKPDADKKSHIVINKIEYMDGSIWKRTAWNNATFSSEDTNKVTGGKCIGI